MITAKQIREDLSQIKFYYAHKEAFDEALKSVPNLNFVEIVKKYNEAIKYAPAKLYGIYIDLYIRANTQESLSEALNYTPQYIYLLNKELISFLLTAFN